MKKQGFIRGEEIDKCYIKIMSNNRIISQEKQLNFKNLLHIYFTLLKSFIIFANFFSSVRKNCIICPASYLFLLKLGLLCAFIFTV